MIEKAASTSAALALALALLAACSGEVPTTTAVGTGAPPVDQVTGVDKAPALAGGPGASDFAARRFCFVDGFFFEDGARDPLNSCGICLPLSSARSFSPMFDGVSCGTNSVCSSGACVNSSAVPVSTGDGGAPGSACTIAGYGYAIGAENPANACQVCVPVSSTTAWSNALEGKPCAGAGSCSAGACVSPTAACSIGGVVYDNGDSNPANICEVCSPGTSTTAWSTITNGAACGNGKACFSGLCTSHFPNCTIGGASYAPGTASPTNQCALCQPRQSMTMFTNAPDGSSCGAGAQCFTGRCESLFP